MAKDAEGAADLEALAKQMREVLAALEDLGTRLELVEQRVSFAEDYIRQQEMDKEAASGEDPLHPRTHRHI